MDKLALCDTMLTLTEAEIIQAKSKYESFLMAARLDKTETIESDEQAQAERAADLAEAFDDRVHEHKKKISALRNVDFGPKSEVGTGAVVGFGNRYLVVAVSTAEFVCLSNDFIGISPNAPIYAAIEGKTAGEVCEFNGREITIGAIY